MNSTIEPKAKKPKQTENIRRHLGESLTIRWGTSRGRDSYGYTTCSLRNQVGRRVAACNGGGYDMQGTVIGNWLSVTFPKELCALQLRDMPANSYWQSERARVCYGKCHGEHQKSLMDDIARDDGKVTVTAEVKLPEDCFECPTCKGPTRPSRDGQRIDTGRGYYGLHFSDPKYNPWEAKLEHCDNTFTDEKDIGKTFKELKEAGKIIDLDLIRTWYKDTSKCATDRHTVPHIDGACGISCVLKIANAIGIALEKVHSSSKLDVYVIRAHTPED